MRKQLLLALAAALILTGCWDKKELANITVVTSMAIDKGENAKFKLTAEGLNSRELNNKTAGGVAPSVVFSEEGDSVAELTKKLNTGLSRHLIYSHMRILVVSEEIAREGMFGFVDYLERNREIRDDFNFLISRNTKAADVLKVTYPFQKSSSMKLFIQLRTLEKEWGGDPDVRMNDVISAWTSPGRQPVLQAVRIKGNPEKGNSVDNMNKVSPDAIVIADSLAVFKSDKLLGFMNIKNTRDYLWTQDNLRQTSIAFPYRDKKIVTVRIYNNKTKMKTRLVGGKAKMNVKVHAVGYVEGTQYPLNFNDVKDYRKVEDLTEKQIQKEVKGTIRKAQTTYKADIFGFGEELYRHYPRDFKKVENKWDEVFSKGDIEVEVIFNLRRSGIRTKSFLENVH